MEIDRDKIDEAVLGRVANVVEIAGQQAPGM
jgi:hypothetical protein